jgi:hypothetical protein
LANETAMEQDWIVDIRPDSFALTEIGAEAAFA